MTQYIYFDKEIRKKTALFFKNSIKLFSVMLIRVNVKLNFKKGKFHSIFFEDTPPSDRRSLSIARDSLNHLKTFNNMDI